MLGIYFYNVYLYGQGQFNKAPQFTAYVTVCYGNSFVLVFMSVLDFYSVYLYAVSTIAFLCLTSQRTFETKNSSFCIIQKYYLSKCNLRQYRLPILWSVLLIVECWWLSEAIVLIVLSTCNNLTIRYWCRHIIPTDILEYGVWKVGQIVI